MNASMVIALALEELIMGQLYRGERFPLVRFAFPHAGKNVAQTLNRELDRNSDRCDLIAEGERVARRSFGENELTTILGHVAWTPSVSKSIVADEWLMTAGIAAIFAIHPDGIHSNAIGRYAKQGFGHPRIYWHAADGMATATLPAAL